MNLKWGKKVECPKCHKIFYDMGKQELTCPGSECHYQFINQLDKDRLNKIHDNEEEVLDSDTEAEFDDNNNDNELSDDDEETLTSSIKRIDTFINQVDD